MLAPGPVPGHRVESGEGSHSPSVTMSGRSGWRFASRWTTTSSIPSMNSRGDRLGDLLGAGGEGLVVGDRGHAASIADPSGRRGRAAAILRRPSEPAAPSPPRRSARRGHGVLRRRAAASRAPTPPAVARDAVPGRGAPPLERPAAHLRRRERRGLLVVRRRPADLPEHARRRTPPTRSSRWRPTAATSARRQHRQGPHDLRVLPARRPARSSSRRRTSAAPEPPAAARPLAGLRVARLSRPTTSSPRTPTAPTCAA